MSDRAAAVASLERVRDKLMDTFDNDRASFTPWAFELLSIVETALGTAHRDGADREH